MIWFVGGKGEILTGEEMAVHEQKHSFSKFLLYSKVKHQLKNQLVIANSLTMNDFVPVPYSMN